MTGYVLIVDDEPDVTNLIEFTIGSMGYAARKASRGREALALINDEPPSLIMLDLMLPDLNGAEILDQLTVNSQTASIPVILVSAYADPKKDQGRWPNVVNIMQKSAFGVLEIRNAVTQVLGAA
jgi:CheY-like chemotaxis protein